VKCGSAEVHGIAIVGSAQFVRKAGNDEDIMEPPPRDPPKAIADVTRVKLALVPPPPHIITAEAALTLSSCSRRLVSKARLPPPPQQPKTWGERNLGGFSVPRPRLESARESSAFSRCIARLR
jgi:hypothetical protein